jgi:hypothetical protein
MDEAIHGSIRIAAGSQHGLLLDTYWMQAWIPYNDIRIIRIGFITRPQAVEHKTSDTNGLLLSTVLMHQHQHLRIRTCIPQTYTINHKHNTVQQTITTKLKLSSTPCIHVYGFVGSADCSGRALVYSGGV